MNGTVRDLHRHDQHFYSINVRYSANCCVRDKLKCTTSQSPCAFEQWPPCVAEYITLCTTCCITANMCSCFHITVH